MSHIITIEVKVCDLEAIRKTCQRMRLAQPCHGKATLFRKVVEGTLVQLRNWKFPIVIDLATGTIRYDNFNGNWGKQEELDKFLMCYGAEKAKQEALEKGHSYSETELENGNLKVVIQPNRNRSGETVCITFLPGGASQVETTGYTGPDCAKASASIETALGTRTDETKKSEYYEVTEEQQQEIQA
jgi:hypothetical protein